MRSLTLPLPPFPFCHSRARGNPGSVQLILVGLHTRAIPWRHLKGACGRGCAPVPNSMWGRGLFERSEFRSPNKRDRGKGTPLKGHARAPMVLGPFAETKGPRRVGAKPHILPLVVRGRNPARTFLLLSFPAFLRDPVSLLFPSHTPQLWIPAFAGMTARVSLLFPSHTLQLWIPAFAGMTTRVSLLFPSHTPQLWIPAFAGMTARVIGNPGSVSSRMSEYIQFYLDGCDDE